MTSLGRWIFFLIILIITLGFGWWFWSLGNADLLAQDTPKFQLLVQSALVELKSAGSSEWKQIAPGGNTLQIRQGDQIHTGQNGKAEIYWGERGITRIEPDTELLIESIPDEEHYMTSASIQLHVTSGRVWTRMLKLLDLDSQVTIKTNDVVATVRGTAFGIITSAKGTDVLVAESGVAVTPIGKSTSLVRQNEAALYRKTTSNGTIIPRKRTLTKNDTWVEEHKKQDREYDLWLKNQMRVRLNGYRVTGLKKLSELLHNKISSKWNEKRTEIMVYRSMMDSRNISDRIKTIQTMPATISLKARQRALANIEALLFINDDAPIEWRTRMEGLRQQMIQPDRLIERRMEQIPLFEAPLDRIFTDPLYLILKQPVQPVPTQPSSTGTISSSTATTSTSVELSLVASPSVGVPDQATTLTVYKIIDGKRAANVTDLTSITFTPPNGTLQGQIFTPFDVGTYAMTAIYNDPDHGRLTAHLDFKVGPAIDVGPASSNSILIQ